MPRNRIIISIAVLIAMLPVIGLPRSWEAFFQVVGGLAIVGLSLWTTIDRKLAMKAKAQMRQAKKKAPTSTTEVQTPVPTSTSDQTSTGNSVIN